MSITIPQSSAVGASRLPREQSRNRRATMAALALFLVLVAAELAVVVALAPTIDPLSDVVSVD